MVFLMEAHSIPKNSSLCSFLIHISLFFLGMRQATGWLGAGVGGQGELGSDIPTPKLSLPRAKKCSAPFKTPHQHGGRECSRQHSLVLHSVTACVVQSAHVVCSEPGFSKSERYTAWRTSQVLSGFSCDLISGSECS